MYHPIVRRRVVGLFAAVSNGNARPVLEGLAPRFEHFFLGDHALGGSRFTLEKTRLWYERLYRLLPDISFDLRAIRISGPPWNTLVAVDWLESNSGTDGVRTFTPGVLGPIQAERRPVAFGPEPAFPEKPPQCG